MTLEIKETTDGRRFEYPCELLSLSDEEAVLLYRTQNTWARTDPGIFVPQGSLGVSYFWVNQNINAYHWIRGGGESIGVYFNVACDTRIGPDAVTWVDLFLDYWVGADGQCGFLDEDEIPPDLPQRQQAAINAARYLLAQIGPKWARDLATRSRSYLGARGVAVSKWEFADSQ